MNMRKVFCVIGCALSVYAARANAQQGYLIFKKNAPGSDRVITATLGPFSVTGLNINRYGLAYRSGRRNVQIVRTTESGRLVSYHRGDRYAFRGQDPALRGEWDSVDVTISESSNRCELREAIFTAYLASHEIPDDGSDVWWELNRYVMEAEANPPAMVIQFRQSEWGDENDAERDHESEQGKR